MNCLKMYQFWTSSLKSYSIKFEIIHNYLTMIVNYNWVQNFSRSTTNNETYSKLKNWYKYSKGIPKIFKVNQNYCCIKKYSVSTKKKRPKMNEKIFFKKYYTI